MTRNHFFYIRETVKDLQSAICNDCQTNIDFYYGVLVGIRSCGLKLDSFMCSILIDIFVFDLDKFLEIYTDDINLDDYYRIVRFRNSLF